jgi:hypothetical protein
MIDLMKSFQQCGKMFSIRHQSADRKTLDGLQRSEQLIVKL